MSKKTYQDGYNQGAENGYQMMIAENARLKAELTEAQEDNAQLHIAIEACWVKDKEAQAHIKKLEKDNE